MSVDRPLPEWERLLAAERHIQLLVAGATLVGGTAAALHAKHRVSLDGDHVLSDQRDRYDYDQILTALEAAAGWKTERIQRPVLILGSMDGILTGIRQLRRTRPLETEVVEDLDEIDLTTYRGLRAPWNDWTHVADRGRRWAPIVARVALGGNP